MTARPIRTFWGSVRIDQMAGEAVRRGGDTVEVPSLGGEPMQAPRVVEAAVHRARAQAGARELKVRFETASDGGLAEAGRRALAAPRATLAL